MNAAQVQAQSQRELSTTRPKSRSLGEHQRFTAMPIPFVLLRTCQTTDNKPDSPLSAQSTQMELRMLYRSRCGNGTKDVRIEYFDYAPKAWHPPGNHERHQSMSDSRGG